MAAYVTGGHLANMLTCDMKRRHCGPYQGPSLATYTWKGMLATLPMAYLINIVWYVYVNAPRPITTCDMKIRQPCLQGGGVLIRMVN